MCSSPEEDLVNAKIRINQRIKDEEERQKNAQKECRNVEQILKTKLKQGRMDKENWKNQKSVETYFNY